MKHLPILGSILSAAILAVTVLAVINAFGVMRPASADNAAINNKLHACLTCCAKKQNKCDIKDSVQKCNTEYDDCVATCNSDGATPSDWGAGCWGA